MEYLEGVTVERIIGRAMALRLVRKVRYIIDACRGLQFAHSRGVIHRDIKPSNIFVTDQGLVKILDFGIALLTDASERRRQTATGVTIGTAPYLSPELVVGAPATQSTDIWALGATMYELLSYQKPFSGESDYGLLSNIISEEPKPLTLLVPDCPVDLERVVAKMLRKDPRERYQAIDEFLPELEIICKNLTDPSVSELLDLSKNWLREGQTARAVDGFREALQIDALNLEAKRLLEKAQSVLKEQSVTTKLRSLVERAMSLLQQGDLSAARLEMDAAIRIDPAYKPALDLREQIDQSQHRSRTVSRLLQQAFAKVHNREFTAVEELAKQTLALDPNNAKAQSLLQQLRAQSQPSEVGVTVLGVQSPPTGFFSASVVSRTRFFEGDQVRYKKIQETLKFYRDHLNSEYQSLSNQAKLTYYFWIISVSLGLGALVASVILLFLRQFAAGSISTISTTFVYFIQKVFQQREDHYRSLATAKHEHLEYGNHWLLVIQSIDAIENPGERERRQGELVEVLTKKLDAHRGPTRTAPRKKKKAKQT
jgi:serine/threonine protein kinase